MPSPASLDFDHAGLVGQLYPAVARAARITLDHRRLDIGVEHKGDGSPVTAADREAEAVLLPAIASALPGATVLSEEAVAAAARTGQSVGSAGLVVMVDPLDGTREYIAGGEDFTVNVGVARDGVAIFGMILQPTSGRLWATVGPDRVIEASVGVPPGPASWSSLPQRMVSTREPDPTAVVALCSRTLAPAESDAFLGGWRIGGVRRLGSSLKFCLMASGEGDIYPRFGETHVWDTCAGQAILTAAGGRVTTPTGEAFTYGRLVHPFINGPFVAWGRASLAQLRTT